MYETRVTAYIFGRLIQLVPLLWAGASLVFILMRLIPGDPAVVMLGATATPEELQALRRSLGLDGPMFEQYLRYFGRLLQGDLGRSIFYHEEVGALVLGALPATLQLAAGALLLAVLIAIPLGSVAAVKRGGFVDRLSMVLAVAGASVPGFWLGVLFILVFSVQLRWLPSTGVGGPPWTLDGLRHLVMPMVALAVGLLASTTRLTRSSMLDVLGEDYIRTAHSKGLRTWFVVMRHGLPNALIPIVTNIGLQAGALLGGALFIETVFAWPGLGRLGVDAMGRRDYPLIQGVVLLTMGVFATVNLVVDVLYARLDPRIRYR
jgi:ABC-type dipeptide/oligopeptide/nickel transport system permease component